MQSDFDNNQRWAGEWAQREPGRSATGADNPFYRTAQQSQGLMGKNEQQRDELFARLFPEAVGGGRVDNKVMPTGGGAPKTPSEVLEALAAGIYTRQEAMEALVALGQTPDVAQREVDARMGTTPAVGNTPTATPEPVEAPSNVTQNPGGADRTLKGQRDELDPSIQFEAYVNQQAPGGRGSTPFGHYLRRQEAPLRNLQQYSQAFGDSPADQNTYDWLGGRGGINRPEGGDFMKYAQRGATALSAPQGNVDQDAAW
jgi:hypothetical protein